MGRQQRRGKGPTRTMRDIKRSSKPEEVKSEKKRKEMELVGSEEGVAKRQRDDEAGGWAVYGIVFVIPIDYVITRVRAQ